MKALIDNVSRDGSAVGTALQEVTRCCPSLIYKAAMAALVDTSIPEITRQLSQPEHEFVEEEVVVKSKPIPPMALLQDQDEEEEEEEREIEPDVVVKSKPRPVALLREENHQRPAIIEVTQTERQANQIQSPESVTQHSSSGSDSQRKANGDVGNTVAPSQALAENIEQVSVNKTNEEFEDSTAMLLRRYTASKNGQHANIPITPTGEIGGTVSMKDTFRVAGKNCTVRLEEDYISWVQVGRKDGE